MKVPSLQTERLRISHLSNADPTALSAYVERNRESFTFTEPTRGPEYFTPDYWDRSIRVSLKELEPLTAVRLILHLKDGTVVGMANLTQIFRGFFQAAYLGYGLDTAHQGQGLMTEALREILRYARADLHLHRVQANHMPENVRSERLLKRLGFEREGYARSYLFLNGAWRDSVLNSLVLSEKDPWSG